MCVFIFKKQRAQKEELKTFHNELALERETLVAERLEFEQTKKDFAQLLMNVEESQRVLEKDRNLLLKERKELRLRQTKQNQDFKIDEVSKN